MQLVEQHRIDRHDPRWPAIDAAAFASKNLYNSALYLTRQAFIHEGRRVTYEDLARDMKTSAEYRALPAKAAQWVLKQVALAWTSYFAACRALGGASRAVPWTSQAAEIPRQAGTQSADLHRAGDQPLPQRTVDRLSPQGWISM